MKTAMVSLFVLALACQLAAGAPQSAATSGAGSFATRCSGCHGGEGTGSDRGPAILAFIAVTRDDQIAALIRKGLNAMPAHAIPDSEMNELLAFLHTLQPPGATPAAKEEAPNSAKIIQFYANTPTVAVLIGNMVVSPSKRQRSGPLRRAPAIAVSEISRERTLPPALRMREP